jgi:hypothetical protein
MTTNPRDHREEMSRTPGPWRVETDEFDIVASDGELLATIFPMSQGKGDAEANARLIAAAPDLLEALKIAHATIYALAKIHDPAWQIYVNRAPEMLQIEAAIAKAEGRS